MTDTVVVTTPDDSPAVLPPTITDAISAAQAYALLTAAAVVTTQAAAAAAAASASGAAQAAAQAVTSAITALVNGAPAILDTLGEIAAKLQADEGAAAALLTLVNTKAAAARQITAGMGLTGGGDLTGDRSLGLSNAAALNILANLTNAPAPPIPNSLSDILDAIIGNSRGTIAVRGAGGWAGLGLGPNGQTLQSNGTDLVFNAVPPGTGGVRFDTAQGLTTPQQAQGLANVGGVSGGMVNRWRNAGLDVWRRGTAAIAVGTAGQYTADGYFVKPAGAGVSVAQAPGRALSMNSLKITGATGVTDVQVVQPIEAPLAAPLAGQVCIFQAQIFNGSGASITPTLSIKHPTSNRDDYSASTTDLTAVALQPCANNAWTQVAYAFTASTSLLGMEVVLDLGALASGNIQLCEVDLRAAAGATVGLISAPPAPELRPITVEQVICNRYLYSTFPPGTTPAQNAGTSGCWVFANSAANGNTGVATPTLFWPVAMRAAPTVTLFNPSAANAQIRNIDASADWAGSAPFLSSFNGLSLTGTQAGSVAQHSGVHVVASAEIAP